MGLPKKYVTLITLAMTPLLSQEANHVLFMTPLLFGGHLYNTSKLQNYPKETILNEWSIFSVCFG